MMKSLKKWWYYIGLSLAFIAALIWLGTTSDEMKPYKDYIFYGIAQNKIVDSERLKVNFTIKGFPYRRHSVYVEVVKPNGDIDFLYSQEHTRNHKAHYHPKGGLRKYKASYVVKNLPKGKYKLRVTFEFDKPGWGRLSRDKIISNLIKFEVL